MVKIQSSKISGCTGGRSLLPGIVAEPDLPV